MHQGSLEKVFEPVAAHLSFPLLALVPVHLPGMFQDMLFSPGKGFETTSQTWQSRGKHVCSPPQSSKGCDEPAKGALAALVSWQQQEDA